MRSTDMTAVRRLAHAIIHVVASAALLSACHDVAPGSDQAQALQGIAAIKGIPQHGATLGPSGAPWTLSVIARPGSYDVDHMITQLPEVTRRFVRSGRLKVRMRTPTSAAYAGNGHERVAAEALQAAGLQGRYWDALVRLVATQRGVPAQSAELASLLRRSGVRDAPRAMSERSSGRVRAALVGDDRFAVAAGGRGRVVYVLGHPGRPSRDITSDAQEGRLAESIALALDPSPR